MSSRSPSKKSDDSKQAPADASEVTTKPNRSDADSRKLQQQISNAVKRIKQLQPRAHEADSIWAQWELGRTIEALRTSHQSATSKSSYQLAREFNLTSSQIKMASYFYRAFKQPEALEQLLGTRLKNNRMLGKSLLLRLCLPRFDAKRTTLLKQVCEENWTERRLREYLSDTKSTALSPRGRIPKQPKYLSEAIACWQRRAEEVIRYANRIFDDKAIDALLKAFDPHPVEVDQVRRLRTRVEEVRKACENQLKVIDQILEQLEKPSPTEPAIVPESPGTETVTKVRSKSQRSETR